MNYGLYMSAAGMLNNMHRQDVTSNNLSNVETTGFKRDLTSFIQRPPEALASGRFDLSHQMMDRLGGGSWVGPSRSDLAPGPLQETSDPLNLAIEGEGFFVVQDERDGEMVSRLTRDGRLKIDPQGRLTTSTSDRPVLSTQDTPIVVDPTQPLHIDERGVVQQGGMEVGQLRLAQVTDPREVRPVGKGLFSVEANVLEQAGQGGGLVRQGFVEQSNVDPIKEMQQMIEATRAINHAGTLISYHDQILDGAVNVLGRVA